MTHSLDPQYFELFSTSFGAALARQIASVDLSAYEEQVPAAWLEIVRSPSEQSIRQLWGTAEDHLPRFVKYLATSVQGAAIIHVQGVHVLMLALPDWDGDYRGAGPGFCWIGTPTNPLLLREFVERVGPIPASLEALWRVANFVTTKQPSKICSLEAAARPLAEAPGPLPPSRADDNGPLYECLKIAVINGEQTTCMVRPSGSATWEDTLAVRFTSTQELSWGVKGQLDCMLVDESVTEE